MTEMDDRIRAAIDVFRQREDEFIMDAVIIMGFKTDDGETWLRVINTDTPSWTARGMLMDAADMVVADNEGDAVYKPEDGT